MKTNRNAWNRANLNTDSKYSKWFEYDQYPIVPHPTYKLQISKMALIKNNKH